MSQVPDIHYSPGISARNFCGCQRALYALRQLGAALGSQQITTTTSPTDIQRLWDSGKPLANQQVTLVLIVAFIPLLAVQSRVPIVLPLPRRSRLNP
jgi:hypothetical protein